MIRQFILAASLLLALPASGTEQSAAFLSDASVGKIVCRAGLRSIVSTGTLINNRTVLAVAHFNFDEARRREIEPAQCWFTQRSSNGNTRFKSRVDVLARGGEFPIFELSSAADWAILNLEEPAPIETFESLSTTEAGHPQNHGVRLLDYRGIYLDCSRALSHTGTGVIKHHCPSIPGSSGGLLLVQEDGQLRLVGMHVGRNKEGGIAISPDGQLAAAINVHRRGL